MGITTSGYAVVTQDEIRIGLGGVFLDGRRGTAIIDGSDGGFIAPSVQRFEIGDRGGFRGGAAGFLRLDGSEGPVSITVDTLASSGQFARVGDPGARGGVSILNGASLVVQDTDFQIGSGFGSTGIVNVTGAGSEFYSIGFQGSISLGDDEGDGTLDISDGGIVGTQVMFVGDGFRDGGDGAVNVDGAGSRLSLGNEFGEFSVRRVPSDRAGVLQVGATAGSGAVNVTNGGSIEITNLDGETEGPTAQFGIFPGVIETDLVISGSGSSFEVHQAGPAEDSQGASFVVSGHGASRVVVADAGILSVTGDGAHVIVGTADVIELATDGPDSLSIRSGGQIRVDSQGYTGGGFRAATQPGSTFDIDVRDAGSRIDVDIQRGENAVAAGVTLASGTRSAASMTITNGGRVDSGDNAMLFASGDQSQAQIVLRGVGSALRADLLLVGGTVDLQTGNVDASGGGSAQLVVSNGAGVFARETVIGERSSADLTGTASGDMAIAGSLEIAEDAVGALTLIGGLVLEGGSIGLDITDFRGGVGDTLNFSGGNDIDLRRGNVALDIAANTQFRAGESFTLGTIDPGTNVAPRVVYDTVRGIALELTGENGELLLTALENSSVEGNRFDNELIGTELGEQINGRGGDDTLIGLGGADTLFGGIGDDTLDGGAGADLLDGGEGFDTVSFQSATTGVLLDLARTDLDTGDAVGDRRSGIEAYLGSAHGDFLRGEVTADRFAGDGGNDTLVGRGGDDLLEGGAGRDVLIGGRGNDVLIGGAEGDYLRGDAGRDTVLFRDATAGVVADLVVSGNNRGDAAGDRYVLIEDIVGSGFDDDLRGNGEGNVLRGRDGDDRLIGRGGNDVLEGGRGADVLTGGTGGDAFLFSDPSQGGDTITDFEAGVDLLAISSNLFAPRMTGSSEMPSTRSEIIDAAVAKFGSILAAITISTLIFDLELVTYDDQTGVLAVDPDGDGPEDFFTLVTLRGAPDLGILDIVVF